MYNFRTDLAIERRDIYRKANKLEEIEGIETTNEEINENIKVSRVKITNQNGENAIGKPIGNYITIDIKNLKTAQEDDIQTASETLTKEFSEEKLQNAIFEKEVEINGEKVVVALNA